MANMTIERLYELFDDNPKAGELSWEGNCHDCSCDVSVTATPQEDGIHIKGGGVFEPEPNRFHLKCNDCFNQDQALTRYQSCEVYSRVVGYLRPVSQWNDAKQEEFGDRKLFDSNL